MAEDVPECLTQNFLLKLRHIGFRDKMKATAVPQP